MDYSDWIDCVDHDSNGILDFGTSLQFDYEEDQAAAMQNFPFCMEEGDYVTDNKDSTGAFNPKVSDWKDADDSEKPSIFIDKAHTNLYGQFQDDFYHITGMIKALPTEGNETDKTIHLFLGKNSKVYRCFHDAIGLPHDMFCQFLAFFFFVCR